MSTLNSLSDEQTDAARIEPREGDGTQTLDHPVPVLRTSDCVVGHTEPDHTSSVVAYASQIIAARPDGKLRSGVPAEHVLKRGLFGLIAFSLAVAFFLVVWTYWQPAHSGVDQNGYLFGGKQFADTLTMKFRPTQFSPNPDAPPQFDPHQFVGKMWVGVEPNTPNERFYPKYPLGLPFLYAVSLWVGGRSTGPWLAYVLSPVAMALAVWGTYCLARKFTGTFPAILAMLVFATSVTTNTYVNNPNSHSTTVCCVVWGMNFLVRWWQRRGAVVGFAGGFLLGYAMTIRYTEGTLILPIAWAVGCSTLGLLAGRLTTRQRRLLGWTIALLPALAAGWLATRWFGGDQPVTRLVGHVTAAAILAGIGFAVWTIGRAVLRDTQAVQGRAANEISVARVTGQGLLVCLGWLLPVGLLLIYNYLAMGTLTGYDSTNESAGFAWKFFADNWRTMLSQLNDNGLVFVIPIAVAGLIAMAWWDWKTAVLFWLWVGPCFLIYTFYYWGPDGVGYLRFVLTAFPALVVAAFWLVSHLADLTGREPARVPLYLLILTMAFVGIGAGAAAHAGLRFDLNYVDPTVAKREAEETPSQAAREDGTVTPRKHYGGVVPIEKYYTQDITETKRWTEQTIFRSGVVMFAVLGGAISAAFFLRRSIVPTLAAGAVAFMAIAVQAADSTLVLETDCLNRAVLAANERMIKSVIPQNSVVICRDESLLHHLSWADDYVLYAGWTFDRGGVNNWSRVDTLEPVLLDPARGKALFERLGKLSQEQLNGRARQTVANALAARRRVFIIEPMDVGDVERRRREKRPLDAPEFVRRYLPGEQFATEKVYAWNVPKVIDPPPLPPNRGPRERDRGNRNREQRPTEMQVVEVKMKG